MERNIGLTANQQASVAQILASLVADEYVLHTKTRNSHWNVRGPQLHDLHKFFEAQYEELDDIVDEMAERIRALGESVPGTLAKFLQAARLKEQPGQRSSAADMIAQLLADYETLIRQLRKDPETVGAEHHDAGTNDFLTGLMEKHEHMAWMLRAHLET
ncbi:MAG: DNA starvation/stationary phase protection protein [Nitrospirota bacterium]